MADQVSIDSLQIAPLVKGKTKGAFIDDKENGKEFSHLVSWINTRALQSQRDKKSKTYVAFVENKAVAYITISMSVVEDIPGITSDTKYAFPVLLIAKLYTDPSSRSLGIGKQLMNFVLDIAQNIDSMVGCRGLIVDANNNAKTVAFYKKYGFEEIDKNSEEETVKMFFKLSDLT